MIAKCLPRYLADQAVVLVTIQAVMREYHVRLEASLNASNSALTAAKCAGKNPSAKSQMRNCPRATSG